MNSTKYGLKRLKSDELEDWLNNPRRKPLVLWSTRQAGKTVGKANIKMQEPT